MFATACSPGTNAHTLKPIAQSLFHNSSVNKMATCSCENSSSVEENHYNNFRPSACDSPIPSQLHVNQNLGKPIMLANYEADDELRRIIAFIKQPDKRKFQKIPAPWREKFSTFLLDPNRYLYMDDRLVILIKSTAKGAIKVVSMGATGPRWDTSQLIGLLLAAHPPWRVALCKSVQGKYECG